MIHLNTLFLRLWTALYKTPHRTHTHRYSAHDSTRKTETLLIKSDPSVNHGRKQTWRTAFCGYNHVDGYNRYIYDYCMIISCHLSEPTSVCIRANVSMLRAILWFHLMHSRCTLLNTGKTMDRFVSKIDQERRLMVTRKRETLMRICFRL